MRSWELKGKCQNHLYGMFDLKLQCYESVKDG